MGLEKFGLKRFAFQILWSAVSPPRSEPTAPIPAKWDEHNKNTQNLHL
ncbi:MAG: hypothetical protein Q8P57_03130 [Candidatus Pacearchaeota archaeon]|nr:hypothetical protein [Candidatus Pacearchaeota archaeon]